MGIFAAALLVSAGCGDDSATTDVSGSDSNTESGTETNTTAGTTNTTNTSNTTSGMNTGGSDGMTEGTTAGSNTTNGPTTDPGTTTDDPSTTAVDPSETDPTATSSTTGPMCVPECGDNNEVLCDGEVIDTCDPDTEVCEFGECVLNPCAQAAEDQSSEGCDFWSVKTGLIPEGSGACFAAFIANTSDQPVHLEVEYNGNLLDVESFTRIPSGQGANITYDPLDNVAGLPVGEVAILFLSRGNGNLPACPNNLAGFNGESAVVGTGLGEAFNIRTDFPVAAYQMLPYGGGSVAATSATLLLPTGTWDDNYVAVNAYTKSQAAATANPLLVFVAREDGTEVTLNPKVAVQGGNGVQGGPANNPIVYNLDRGDTIQIEQAQELTGSPVTANKAMGMFGGASCLNVPINAYACDGAHQQIPPVNALGNNYTAVRYRNRTNQDEAPPWRLVGMVDGTQLTWTNQPPGAPNSLDLGQVAEFTSTGPFQVASQDEDHPFYAAAYMTGGQSYGGAGDPEWVNIVPSEQYLEKYVLFTDPTYPETSLVVVRSPDDNNNFADVNLGCYGNLDGWMPIGNQEYTRVQLVTGNFQDQGNCSNGRHEMSSANPFGVTVWGWGSSQSQVFTQYVSYAYPAGARVAAINDVIIQ
ncbi:MAG: IgGFc-binding protein [Myxococcales bacterium]|nr:IgGFc-binding protein [Myxococcales bacterium]